MSDSRVIYSIPDHALLRWLERVHDIDIEFFRAEMRREVENSVLRYGEIDGLEEGSPQFVIDGDAVVTVLLPGQRLKKQKWIGGYAVPRVAISGDEGDAA